MKCISACSIVLLLAFAALAAPGHGLERGVQLDLRSNEDVASSDWLDDGNGTAADPYILRPPRLVDAVLPAGLVENVTAHVIIDGFSVTSPVPNGDRAGAFIVRDSSNVTIRNAKFYGFQGISIEDSEQVSVTGTTFQEIGEAFDVGGVQGRYRPSAIHVRGSEQVTVSEVQVSGLSTGVVFAQGSQDATVRASEFSGQFRQSIAVWLGADHVRIENNSIHDALEGILVAEASTALVANNTIRGTATGVVLHGDLSHPMGGDVLVVDNALCNVKHGFLPHYLYEGRIERNLVDGSDVAIDVRNDWTIRHNIIRDSDVALDVTATRDYLVAENDITDFTTSVRTRTDATLEDNWWGQLGGPDPATVIANDVSVDTTPASERPHEPLLPGTTCTP